MTDFLKQGRVIVIARKEWQEITRDPVYLSLAVLLPVIMMIVFGYGMTQDVNNVAFAIVDYDRSSHSRDYASHFGESREFRLTGYLPSVDHAERQLVAGDVRFVMVIPENFSKQLGQGQSAAVQFIIDGAFTMALRTIDGYVNAINAAASVALQVDYLSAHSGMTHERAETLLQPITLQTRYLFNQELRDIWSVAPSLIMFILTITAPLMMALSIVREKETGTIYNIFSSNCGRAEYLVGKLVPNIIISSINAFILIGMATLYFSAPLKGSLPFMMFACVLYVSCISTTGLFISILVRTQVAAVIISVVVGFIIVQQFSGMMVPVTSLTGFNYYFSHMIPPMYFNDAITNTFLKGGGLSMSWRECGMLLMFFLGYFWIGFSLFHKRVSA